MPHLARGAIEPRIELAIQNQAATDAGAEEDADRIAEGIKAEWWSANKEKFIPPRER